MSALEKLGKAIRISRPLFWPAPFAAYAAGIIIGGVPHSLFVMWEFFLATFPLSFAVYFLNDYFDMPYDAKNPRKGGVWGYRLTKADAAWAWKLCAAFAILAVITAILSFNLVHAALIAVGMILPLAYSAPPLRLKNIPVLDSISNAGYAFIPFAAAASLGGSLAFLDYRVLVAVLIVAAFHALATIMDYRKDKEENQATFAVVLGPRAPAVFAASIFLLNLAVVFPYLSAVTFGLILALALSLALAVWPEPKNAVIVFKALMGYSILVGYILMLKYALFTQFADYAEPEIGYFIRECRENPGGPLSALCPTFQKMEDDCSIGTENPAMPGFCDYLSRETE
ncbi:MAG: UbiA family prenyltransferase [Candidatus Micrarchaeota archaeon]